MTDRVIRVVLDSRGVVSGVRQASGQLQRLEQRQRGLTTGFRQAAAAASAFAGALVTREVLRLTNTYQSLQNQLRVVTNSQQELNAAQARLTEIAQETRAPLQSTVELFSRASIAAGELGASQEELFRLTEITGQALAVQGSSAQESAGALRQLSQSFSSGIVRAEEFNSILEGAFPLAQAAARGFDEAGGSVGRLRNLVVEGRVSSTEFFNAILDGSELLEEQFGQTDVTISQAFTNIQNSLIGFVGALGETSGAGRGFATVLQGISEQIDDLGGALTGTLQPQDEVNSGLQLFASVILVATRAVGFLADSLTTVLVTAFQSVGNVIGGTIAGIVEFLSGNFEEASVIFDEVGADFVNTFVDNFSGLRDELIADTSQTIESLVELWDAGARDIAEAAGGGAGDGGGDEIVTVDPEKFQEAADGVGDFLAALAQGNAELQLQADLGEEADEAIRRYREDIQLAAAANELFGDLTPTPEVLALRDAFIEAGEAGIQETRRLREELEAGELAQTFQDQIDALTEEIDLLDATNAELGANAEARALAAGATAQQAEQIGMLTEQLLNEKDALAETTPSLRELFDDFKDAGEATLSGILSDPINQDLEAVAFSFAQTLQQLASELLASEIFNLLSGGGGGGGGGGGFFGAITSFIGGLFGGGFQAGGQVRGGQPILVGERGPEIFTPPGSGAVQPNVNIAQAAQAPPTVNVINVSDPADVPTGINSPEGEEAVINVIQRNPDAVRRLLG